MNGIDFHEDNDFHIRSRRLLGEPETPSMIRFLLRSGVAKTEKQALFILIGVISVALLATVFIMRGRAGGGSDYIMGLDGRRYNFDEYMSLVEQGRDPLDPRSLQ